MKIRTRMAPSPTGNLHIGTARTTLFNWLFARHHGGEFILRIEDTDLERSSKEYEENIIEGLKWLGLNWDNPEIYRQSERLDIYEEYLVKLLDQGKAFWCYHTKDELEDERKQQVVNKEAPRHICSHKHHPPAETGGEKIIRLAVNSQLDRKIGWEDVIRGHIEFEEGLLGNFSLAKDLRIPLYNFAVVADDITMEISHVIRGEDHISNTPKQLLIYEALGAKPPVFAHNSMIYGPDKAKLSKRHGATSISEYRKDYLPEAILNFMGFLGFTYSHEILSKEEMAKEFDLAKVHKSAAIFDQKKLNWVNSRYIKKLSAADLKKLVGKEIPDIAIPLITERLEKISDAGDFNYLWEKPEYEAALLIWRGHSREDTKLALEKIARALAPLDFFSPDQLKIILDEVAADVSAKIQLPKTDRGLAYWPLRVALSGHEKSPDPVELALVLGKEKTLERVVGAIEIIG
ncbi:MAG: glutamate--tRNA ligase [Candidatus Yanofskybacteria bacterium RIFCSPHIGHO2_02_FULL_46_19]|uniref:Glutamate--tRNA ligase n=2 Tax=Candidatus Yanofskyibacteriota TaxID=1752733 RepID=A0A1F8H4I6_9BACT|nr:MAG: glutamate--tRNA ligase [Candidatus Yanofskybacteria bacterium RIFCSPHIGHO2_02_FULL_46_19]OGN27082.1 MAG: glutamate--tRNA ligase [Candidatus Yanofskybacteria bacterium RIFCSPLOWO2_01_FULL_45_72]OGN32503.1 MAG: glutamate--tRNA ligase [Candidatus Yanofskybacteria bacterium RIFCSPLOWO2_02_FULL_45_18]